MLSSSLLATAPNELSSAYLPGYTTKGEGHENGEREKGKGEGKSERDKGRHCKSLSGTFFLV